jgi:hypothetical protein
VNTLASFLMVGLLSLGVAYGLQLPRNQPSARTAIPNPHHHATGEDVLKDVGPEIKIVESKVPENAELQNLLLNKSERFSSFTVTTEEGLERIFVRQVLIPNRSDKAYEIQGVAWPNRPLSDAVWAGDYFIFDRSSNPHAAIHYVFDMQKRALVAARAFTE